MAVLLCIVARKCRGVNLRHGHEKLRSGVPRETQTGGSSTRQSPGPARLFVVSCGLSFISATMRRDVDLLLTD